MKPIVAALTLSATLNGAVYLGRAGFHVGSEFLYNYWERDSVIMLGEFVYSGVDSVAVRDTAAYGAFPGMERYDSTYAVDPSQMDTIRTTTVDTVWEVDSTVHELINIGPTARAELTSFNFPLTDGKKWDGGADGTYIDDFDGDFVPDTLVLLWDSLEVLRHEQVTVPAGTFANAAVVEFTAAGNAWSSFLGTWGTVDYYGLFWVAVDTGVVKDTFDIVTVFTIPAAHVSITRELTSYFVTAEERTPSTASRALLLPVGLCGEVRYSMPSPGTPLEAYSPDGRLVAAPALPDREGSVTLSLPRGVYLLRAGEAKATLVVR